MGAVSVLQSIVFCFCSPKNTNIQRTVIKKIFFCYKYWYNEHPYLYFLAYKLENLSHKLKKKFWINRSFIFKQDFDELNLYENYVSKSLLLFRLWLSLHKYGVTLILVKLIKHRRCTKHSWISVNTCVMNISGKYFYSMRKTLTYYIVKLYKKKHEYQMEFEQPSY